MIVTVSKKAVNSNVKSEVHGKTSGMTDMNFLRNSPPERPESGGQ
jgi:hypothetical protein